MNDHLPPALVAAADQGLAVLRDRLDAAIADARNAQASIDGPTVGLVLLDLIELDHWELAGVAALAVTRLIEGGDR